MFIAILVSAIIVLTLYALYLRASLFEKQNLDNKLKDAFNEEIQRKTEECNAITMVIDRLYQEEDKMSEKIKSSKQEIQNIVDLIAARKEQLNEVRTNIALETEKCEKELQKKKEEVTAEYNAHVEDIQNSISNVVSAFTKQEKAVKESLATLENYVSAIIEAQKRATEEKDKTQFYMLTMTDIELEDIAKLLNLSLSLHQPDILKKLVYKTYFEKKMNDLLGRVVGVNSEISAIYKITHIETGMAYIGQAVNIKERWRKHLKCGLGIDTPATNVFYQNMMHYKPWNFSWEILEKCPKEKLNEAEKFYIDFYQTKSWGWNSKGGNTK